MSTPAAAPAAASGASSAPSSSNPSTPSASSTTSTPSSPATSSNKAPATSSTGGGGDPGAKAVADSNAPAGDSAKQEAAKVAEAERKWKLKVNGADRELSEAELIRRAQLGYSADEKYQQAAEMKSMAESFLQALRSNPLEVLMHPELGINFREVAEQYLAGELKKEMLPPEQRELEELREYRRQQQEAAENSKKEELTKAQQAEFNKLKMRAAEDYDVKITEVLKQADLPKTAETVKHVAVIMRDARMKGYDIDIPTAVDMVRESQVNSLRSYTKSLKGESLVKFLGDDLVKELRQFDLARIRAKLEESAPQAPQPFSPPAERREESSQHLKPDEWKEMLRKKAGF